MKFPESALAHELLDGLVGIEIGGAAHNGFVLDTWNVDQLAPGHPEIERYDAEQLRMGGEVMPIDVVSLGHRLPFRTLCEHLGFRVTDVEDPDTKIGNGFTIVIDLQAVGYLDSASIGCLMDVHRLLQEKGGALRLSGLQPRVETMISMTGVHKIVPLHRDEQEALDGFDASGEPER